MPRQTLRTSSRLNRRSALGGVGVAAAALGLGTVSRVAAQDAAPGALTGHPIVGAWLVMNPGDPPNAGPVIFSADGTMSNASAPNYVDPQLGLTFQGSAIGVWEPTGERSVHCTLVQPLSAPDGTYLGTFTLDAFPEVNEDWESFFDDGTKVHVTIRDATNAITVEIGGEGAAAATPPVHAQRMHVGHPGFPDAAPTAGTPTG